MDFVNVTNDFSPITTRLTSRSDRISGLSSLSLPDMMASPFIKKNLFSPGPTTVLSPVTNLALNMNNLAGLGSQQCDTPKRKRVPLLKIPSFASDCSSDAGLGMDSPSPMDPIHVEETFEKAILQSGRVVNEKMPIRRINSLPLQLLDFSPALKGPVQESQDQHFYGDFERLGPAKDAATSSGHSGHGGQGNKENQEEGFEFKKPTKAMSPCRMRSFHSGGGQNKDDARWPSSAPALMLSSSQRLSSLDDRSPVFLHRCTLDDDDGFLDVLDDCEQCDMPVGMSSLLTAPLVRDGNAAGDDSPVVGCRPRGLFRSPSMPSQVGRVPLKRPQDQNTPVRVKRQRSLVETRATTMDQDDRSPSKMVCSEHHIQRSKSFCNHTEIEKLLDKELIGDFTKPFVLSTVQGKHQDLKYITPEMMVSALSGQLDHLVERIMVIDCRYPYEFDGGHIKGALNLHQEEQIEEYLLRSPIAPLSPDRRVLLVFHCEFSSERGPRMCRFVRERDRTMNQYPNLHYPELYILKGGYKEFFHHFQMQCEPQGYRPMDHQDFKEDLKNFRLKSRTWAGERSKRELYSRLKKL
ncbi:M-phase inducer phosphatase 2 [Coregonus clupeaformis]|uniref:M-phase inducer phosphatase 2 n=1 Tax=Coregonus clupeaformis TaxID=59861 RepID=UPI001E1C3134|nr:M-phase inducer phosphatase 2 [Coregonus clupeaformis]